MFKFQLGPQDFFSNSVRCGWQPFNTSIIISCTVYALATECVLNANTSTIHIYMCMHMFVCFVTLSVYMYTVYDRVLCAYTST